MSDLALKDSAEAISESSAQRKVGDAAKDTLEGQPPAPSSQEIVELLVDQVNRVTAPLARLALLDQLSHELMPALYERMIETAAEFRAADGTWRQIGEHLGVTPQAAQQRFDEAARHRKNVKESRARRAKGDN